MIIAIDGPAAAGKSTVARKLAEALGFTYLDTGAMYRAVTLAVLDGGVDPASERACGELARSLELAFDPQGRITIDGRPGEPRIRGAEVTAAVSTVSAHPAVRAAVVARQRHLAREADARGGGLVAEGRDTTTVVFPAAEHKFFLIATAPERARRRARELHQEHRWEAIQADLERRDHLDSTRAASPLVEAPGAQRIETDGQSVEQVVARILTALRRDARR
jgi:cytidylate kinase